MNRGYGEYYQLITLARTFGIMLDAPRPRTARPKSRVTKPSVEPSTKSDCWSPDPKP